MTSRELATGLRVKRSDGEHQQEPGLERARERGIERGAERPRWLERAIQGGRQAIDQGRRRSRGGVQDRRPQDLQALYRRAVPALRVGSLVRGERGGWH